MKKMISSFANALLSREDLMRVKGGYGGDVTRMMCCYTEEPYLCSECGSITPGSGVSCVTGALPMNC